MKCAQCGSEMPDDAAFCGECGTAAGSAGDFNQLQTIGGLQTEMVQDTARRTAGKQAELEPGTVFADRFTIRSLIGRGGMGVVYAANDRVTEQDVALKLIRRDRLSGPDSVRKLVREGVTTRDIRHPNVVSVYDVGDADGQPYMSMELLTGQSLRQWIREKARAREDVSYPVAERIVREILAGLKAAHDKGIIHRDLKPENIMLLHRPEADAAPLRVADFGIAQAMGAQFETGGTGALGTREYMAPEQITNPDAAAESADLYSLSVIFYELLVGVLPQGHWQPPSGGRDDVPPHVDKLIEKGLSNRPMSRPQSVEEYETALDVAAPPKPTPPQPRPDPVPDPAPKPAAGIDWQALFRSRKFKIGAAVVIGIGLVGAVLDEMENPTFTDPGNGAAIASDYLSGSWSLAVQNGQYQEVVDWNVGVAPDGRVSGSVYAPGVGNIRIDGNFNGNAVNLTLTGGGSTESVTGYFDGGCHIDIAGVGRLHVNHEPGASCP